MRSRSVVSALGIVVLVALLLTPFVIGEGVEPEDDSFPRFAYVFFVAFFGLTGLAGWGIGYINRGATAVGLARYVVGNLVVTFSFVFIVLFAWVAIDITSGWMCMVLIAPFVWFGVASARWHDVKYPPGYESELVEDYVRKQKTASPSSREPISLHGSGTEVSLPVRLERGMYRLGYRFSGSVPECSILLASADDPTAQKRTIAMPESNLGGEAFSVTVDGRYVFQVDAVNDVGEILDWELTVDDV